MEGDSVGARKAEGSVPPQYSRARGREKVGWGGGAAAGGRGPDLRVARRGDARLGGMQMVCGDALERQRGRARREAAGHRLPPRGPFRLASPLRAGRETERAACNRCVKRAESGITV